jgi:hypothetical protein
LAAEDVAGHFSLFRASLPVSMSAAFEQDFWGRLCQIDDCKPFTVFIPLEEIDAKNR